MYRATKNLFAVMNVMGHTTVSTTMKYQHQDIDEVAAVASRRVQLRTQKGHNRWGQDRAEAAK
jgi:site-specific recombinase XerC